MAIKQKAIEEDEDKEIEELFSDYVNPNSQAMDLEPKSKYTNVKEDKMEV